MVTLGPAAIQLCCRLPQAAKHMGSRKDTAYKGCKVIRGRLFFLCVEFVEWGLH